MGQDDDHIGQETEDPSRTLDAVQPMYGLGSHIEGYKLLSVLGEGGMGVQKREFIHRSASQSRGGSRLRLMISGERVLWRPIRGFCRSRPVASSCRCGVSAAFAPRLSYNASVRCPCHRSLSE